MSNNILLGVNIDHIATIRQVRGVRYPDPVQAALLAEEGGADGITVHLREDRRHIQERDVQILQETINTRLNLEMAPTEAMVKLAIKYQPAHCCIVPEKRQELTTEGGLDVVKQRTQLKNICSLLQDNQIEVSLFIDPETAQIDAACECGVKTIELHTGAYAEKKYKAAENELKQLMTAANYAKQCSLIVNAGHGLNYHNVRPIAQIHGMNELNIGHAIVARAFFVGIKAAVVEMKQLLISA